MRIVFLIDQVFLHGGIERVLSIKANYFASDPTNEVHVVTTEQQEKAPCYDFNTKVNFTDINIKYVRNKSYFHPKNLLKLPSHIYKIKTFLKKTNPDIVIVCSHSTDTYFIPFIVKHIPKIKEFHYSKSIEKTKRNDSKNNFKKLFLEFTDYVETKYDKLVVLNKDEQTYYKSQNTLVIPNPLTFSSIEKSKLSNKIVIAAGRIAPVKGFEDLIDIWELVSLKNTEWELHIYGEGLKQYTDELQQKIESKKLNKTIILKGATKNIKSKMLNASIYAMTSHNECFPLVLLEAQACGLPIISYDCPHGPKNIISKNTGLLIEQYNKQEFSDNLLSLFKNHEFMSSLGNNAKENAKKYTLNKVMQKWVDLFETLKPN